MNHQDEPESEIGVDQGDFKSESGQHFPSGKDEENLRKEREIAQAFEKAGFKVLELNQVSPAIRTLIQGGKTQDESGAEAKPEGKKPGQTIFGKPKARDGVCYFVQKTSEGCIWSRIWMEGKEISIESLAKNPAASDVMNILWEKEFGERPKAKNVIAKGVRASSKGVLATPEKKNGAR